MNETPVAYPGLRRAGHTLIAAGLLGYIGFFLLDHLLPIEVPAQVREDRFQLAAVPKLHTQPKAPAYLELTDGGVPARIPNFQSIEPEDTRQKLLALKPGTEVTVLRPTEPTTWFNGYDILALRIGDTPLLNIETTLSAHARKSSGSRAVLLAIAAVGTLVLLARKLLARRHVSDRADG